MSESALATRTLVPCPDEEVARLTSAARVVLARGGWWGFKVDSVLRVAGLSTRCFYRHFESKDHLLLRMLEQDTQRAAWRLAGVCTDADPAARVRAWVDGVMDMAYVARVAKPTALFTSQWHQLLARFPLQVGACRVSLVAPLKSALEDLEAVGCDIDVDATLLALFYVVCGSTAEAISCGGTPSRDVSEAWVIPTVERLLGVALPAASHHAWPP